MGIICAVSFFSPYDQGGSSLEQLASRFMASVGWAKKISAQRKRIGQAERAPHQPGRKPYADVEAQKQVIAWVAAEPDLTLAIEAATDAEIFLAYMEHVLCPALKPGNVVVMNNLSSHKVSGVREWIEKAGAEALYLQPYSPDLNPIEKAWAKLKQLLRTAKARTQEALDKAIEEVLKLISPDNAKAWFRHCIDWLQYYGN
jgi:transposase